MSGKDDRTRKERRADPERWYEIVSYFDEGEERFSDVDGYRLTIRGQIEDVIVVQVPPDVKPKDAHRVMRSVQKTLEGAGIDKPMVLMPSTVSMMKVRPLSKEKSKNLDRLQEVERVRAIENTAKGKSNDEGEEGNRLH